MNIIIFLTHYIKERTSQKLIEMYVYNKNHPYVYFMYSNVPMISIIDFQRFNTKKFDVTKRMYAKQLLKSFI